MGADHNCRLVIGVMETRAPIFHTSDHDPLRQHLLHGDRLFFCSDGGSKDHAGSFGWVIATATTIGIAAGWFANSFRSEGVGQLSLLVFNEAHITYHGLQDVPTPQLPPKSTLCLRIATPITTDSSSASGPVYRLPQCSQARLCVRTFHCS